MKAPVGLLSDRTVLRSKMEGLCPDKFQFVEQIRNKQQQLGEPHDFTHKQQWVWLPHLVGFHESEDGYIVSFPDTENTQALINDYKARLRDLENNIWQH